MGQDHFYSDNMNSGKIIGIIGIFLILIFVTTATKNIVINGFNTDDNVQEEVGKVNNNGEVQRVDLTVKDFNYYPQVLNLKYGVPVEIAVDTKKVKGCLQSIVIQDFGIRKYVTAADNLIKFTPNKKGTFSFSCSMGMGYGKIVVT